MIVDLDFVDENHGWILSDSRIYATSNGGLAWHELELSIGFINEIQLLPGGLAFALVTNGFPTDYGALMKSSDGGDTWRQIYPPLAPMVWELYDAHLAYGVGSAFDVGAVLRSWDGGRSWQRIGSLGEKVITPYRVHFITPQEGWITAQASLYGGAPVVFFYTKDGGHTWQAADKSFSLKSPEDHLRSILSFVDQRVGHVTYGNQLWKTEDGGLTLHQLPTQGKVIRFVQFATPEYGWGWQAEQIYETHDGGSTWQPMHLGYLVPVLVPSGGRPFSLLPDGQAWVITGDCEAYRDPACRRLLLFSSDFGQTWDAYDLGETYFEEIHFVDALHGWARGGETDHGGMKGGYIWGNRHIYLTDDGGRSWEMVR